jgi:hypothetical protein
MGKKVFINVAFEDKGINNNLNAVDDTAKRRRLACNIFKKLLHKKEYMKGAKISEKAKKRLMFTLTATRQQFRVWYERPLSVRPSHVS